MLSGSSPESDEAFAALSRLRVKTIISVDGAQPDVASAHRHGLRYVHLPHGYGGISTEVQLRLVKAARTLPGPIHDAGDPSHQCAITFFSCSQLDLAPAEVALIAPLRQPAPLGVGPVFFFATVDYRLSPSRAPPLSLS